MHRKSDSLSCFKMYHKYAEAHTGAKVRKINVLARSSNSGSRLKALRTDNGGEYLSTEFKTISRRMESSTNRPSRTLLSTMESLNG